MDNNIVFSETRCLEKVPHTKKLFIEVSFMLFVLSFDFSIVYDDIFSRVTLKSVINIIMLCHFPAFVPRAYQLCHFPEFCIFFTHHLISMYAVLFSTVFS